MNWLSLHAHLARHQDEFLAGDVAALVADGMARGAIESFFFLRHWEHGPHLRLRFRLAGEPDEHREREWKEHVATALRARCVHEPPHDDGMLDMLSRIASVEQAAFDPQAVVSAGEVRVHAYRPEWDKYGGRAGVAIAEAVFHASSAVALQALQRRGERWPSRRLGLAFSMMAVALRAFGLDTADSLALLRRYRDYWNRYSAVPAQQAAPSAAPVALAQTCRQLATNDHWREVEHLRPWTQALLTARHDIEAHRPALITHVRLAGAPLPADAVPSYLLMSYMHTNNNRLGVMAGEESYVAHLLAQCLDETAAGVRPDTAEVR